MVRRESGSPIGVHRVIAPAGVLPQAAWRLDDDPEIYADEVRLRVERLNLDAASFRQLREAGPGGPEEMRRAVLGIVAERGKMHNPVTGSGGMLIGTVEEVGPASPLGLRVGERVATLVSLTLTPLRITDALAGWDGGGEQVAADGHAILFARSVAARVPPDLPVPLALAVLDVCGAPALTARVVGGCTAPPRVLILGGSGKSGGLAAAAARAAGARQVLATVPDEPEAARARASGLYDTVAVADARDPLATAAAVGVPAEVTVVCVDVPGAEGAALLATGAGGTIVFFSMATSFPAAALGAEGLAADVTMLIGNGYVPGHADLALELVRRHAGVRRLFDARLDSLDVSSRASA